MGGLELVILLGFHLELKGLINGKLNGKKIEYYKNGDKKFEGEYLDGKLMNFIYTHTDGRYRSPRYEL